MCPCVDVLVLIINYSDDRVDVLMPDSALTKKKIWRFLVLVCRETGDKSQDLIDRIGRRCCLG